MSTTEARLAAGPPPGPPPTLPPEIQAGRQEGADGPLALRDDGLSVAIVHDWCPSFRGGERVLAELCALAPGADVFTLFDFLPAEVKEEFFAGVTFHTSVADRLPFVQRYYRALFFLCPLLIEQFDVMEHDVVLSSSAAFSRGVITRPDQPHLCYVHSPIRYAWDEQFTYLKRSGLGFGPRGALFRYLLHRLRTWDARTAHGPDVMVANSSYVRARIRRIYGRDARVVFPPVAVEAIEPAVDKEDYYVTASFLAPYKRVDLVIEAFNRMPSRKLIVIGEGQEAKTLKAQAGPNVVLAGFLPRAQMLDVLARARAFVYAGCEDFGITLAEAQACGTPLIAFGRGGAADIVRTRDGDEDATGVLFGRQTADALVEAVAHFEAHSGEIRPDACRENALRFSTQNFRRQMSGLIDATLASHRRPGLAA